MIIFSSCSDFLQEYSQDKDYVRTWEDLDESLLGSCYMPVKVTRPVGSSLDYDYFLHFMGDELEEQTEGYS